MELYEWMRAHGAAAEQIDGPGCLARLMEQMADGLDGRGPIPMLPSYLGTDISIPEGAACCVMDAGGTNLRTARAVYTPEGWRLEALRKQAMPGTAGERSFREFYDDLAGALLRLGRPERVGFCFSYNVSLDRTLDGRLDFWCKEVRVPEAVGQPVGASLREALGGQCRAVRVLNDSVAAMLGAENAHVGVILGTGVNVCYPEPCAAIGKVPADLRGDAMIISTEVGEFDGFPRSPFEESVIAASDAPGSAIAEKQCSGGYLGGILAAVWRAAREDGLLTHCPESDLGAVSRLLEQEPGCPAARLAAIAVHRAAKIAAVLCAGPILRTGRRTVRVAVEGSQYWRLTGFREAFHRELDRLLPEGTVCEILRTENACLLGAARAAFAEPM